MTPAKVKPAITPELLDQIDVRVGTIESVNDVTKSDKLVALRVNFGDHVRTVLAGMKRELANPREVEGETGVICRESSASQDGGHGFRSHAV